MSPNDLNSCLLSCPGNQRNKHIFTPSLYSWNYCTSSALPLIYILQMYATRQDDSLVKLQIYQILRTKLVGTITFYQFILDRVKRATPGKKTMPAKICLRVDKIQGI